MTDEELDALVKQAMDRAIERLQKLHSHAGRPAWDQVLREELSGPITTLRAQLAEANARADRAEAALAAQIEASPVRTTLKDRDGREICLGDRLRHMNESPYTKPEYWFPEYEVVWDAPSFRLKHVGGGKPSDTGFAFRHHSKGFETIHNQPHDRTALERTLAEAREQTALGMVDVMATTAKEAREKALREAADELRGQGYGNAVRTILALIEKPNAR